MSEANTVKRLKMMFSKIVTDIKGDATLQYAIKCIEAVQLAKSVLPEKKDLKKAKNGQCDEMLDLILEENEYIECRNNTIDEVTPIVTKLIIERDEALRQATKFCNGMVLNAKNQTELEAQIEHNATREKSLLLERQQEIERLKKGLTLVNEKCAEILIDDDIIQGITFPKKQRRANP